MSKLVDAEFSEGISSTPQRLKMNTNADVIVIGGGIIGMATAMKLQQQHPDGRVVVLEAERNVGLHQTGHNSGVIHSGIYYKPGSEKALCCRAGKAALEMFCDQHKIPWDRCGKVVVATNPEEVARLDSIAERATANGVDFERIDTDALRELEPSVAGLAALRVPETGIVNFRAVCQRMADELQAAGGTLEFNFPVCSVDAHGHSVRISSRDGRSVEGARLINCGGLQSDRIARMAGVQTDVEIVPFRGEYYELQPGSESLCRNLIYPVPDPAFPFLGVHFTRMIDGGVECGPNAVLALSRNGYGWSKVSATDLAATLSFRGFRRLAGKHWRMGALEVYRSLSKHAFVKALQKLIPSIRKHDLKPGRAGVRAQAVSPEGNLIDDFLFGESENAVHVLNAPSPGATASLAIAERIIERSFA